jgi:hypothetical protein
MSVRRTAKSGVKSGASKSTSKVAWLGLTVGLLNLGLLLILLSDRYAGASIDPFKPLQDGSSSANAQVASDPLGTPTLGLSASVKGSQGALDSAVPTPPAQLKQLSDVIRSTPLDTKSKEQEPDASASVDLAQELALDPSARAGIRLQVLNGVGKRLLAAKVGDALMKMRYDIREKSNTKKRLDSSQILCRGNNRSAGLRLAADLGLAEDRVILESDKALVDVDLTLIVGSDWKRYKLPGF